MDLRADRESWRGREVARLLDLLCSESRYYQEIVASLPVPLAVVAADGELLTSNLGFQKLFHLRAGDSGRKIRDVVPSTELMSAIDSAVRGGASDVELPAPFGSLRFSVTPLRGWGGGADGEALLTAAAAVAPAPPTGPEGFPAVLWSMDPDSFRFTALSGNCEELFGAPPDHWLSGRATAFDRIHPAGYDAVTGLYRQAVANGGAFSCEFRTVTSTQKEKWIRDSFRVVRDPDGRVRIAGVTIDITGRRKSDEHATMAHRADALAGLSRRLAHDLNNALMIISGYGEELLAHFAADDPRRSDMQALMSAAETIAGIAGELQGFTRPQSAPKSVVAIGEVLEAVSPRIRSELGAVLVTRVLDHTLSAGAEASQLEAILLSLARALRHASDPHMILSAARERVSDDAGAPLAPEPGEFIEIVLRAPVDSALEPRAFENLIAGRDPHGADLARAYAVIREWGGWIRAARTEQSAEVRLLLPATGTAVAEPAVSHDVPVPEEPPPPLPRAAATILVVEDEQGIRTLVRRILDREGYRVLDAANAAEAGDTLRRSPTSIDLLITDVRLPGESGRQLAERLTAAMPELRIIYMSGYTGDPELPGSIAGSGPAFLQKPFTRTALVKRVQEALAAKPGAALHQPAHAPD